MGDIEFPDPYSIPLADIDVARAELFQRNLHWRYFERLRAEDPVHYCTGSEFGPYWSVTKFKDIMEVDTHHQVYSSEGGITLGPPVAMPEAQMMRTPMFIAMDPPKHDLQRATVSPVVAPRNLVTLESTIRERAGKILDALPRNQTFNWVERVSIELTTQMLATLFDFPFEDRYKLTRWSDVATAAPGAGVVETARTTSRRTDGMPRLLHAIVERARQRTARPRPDLDARARRVDAEHGSDGVPRQPDSADRRRQRHDA